jgi:hypothetical protein
VLGVLNLVTGGWQFYFDFELAREHPSFATFWPSMRELLRLSALALGLPVVLAAGLAWRARAELRSGGALVDRARTALAGSADARLASMLLITVAIGIPAGVYFRLKVGSDVNQYIGVIWAAGLLTAIAYRRSRRHAVTALVASAAILALFALSQRPADAVAGARVPPVWHTFEYTEVSPELLKYARGHLVYEQVQSDLNVEPQGSIYPNFYNFVDLLAAGRQPDYLVEALLDRRFDAVAPFSFASAQISLFWEIYASGAGRREANYFWKLNRVIEAGYGPTTGVPTGFLGRRPGPSRAPWMRSCFGPFDLSGIEFGIRAGGGFWCRDGTALTLRETPAPRSEVHSLDRVPRVAGALGVRLPSASGSFRIALRGDSGSWVLDGRRAGARVVLALSVDGGESARTEVPYEETASLAFGEGSPALGATGDEVEVTLPDVGEGDLSISAARGSLARFDLAGLNLGG